MKKYTTSSFTWCDKCKDTLLHDWDGIYNYRCKKCGLETDRTPSPDFNDTNYTLLWYRNLHNKKGCDD